MTPYVKEVNVYYDPSAATGTVTMGVYYSYDPDPDALFGHGASIYFTNWTGVPVERLSKIKDLANTKGDSLIEVYLSRDKYLKK